jgi:uncharacterized membrane protein
MIRLEYVYILAGLMFGAFAVMQAFDRSHPKWWRNVLFWGVYAVTFLFGSYLPDVVNGVLVIVMVLIAGFGGLGRGGERTTSPDQRQASARHFGNRLFIPALTIAAVAVVGTVGLKGVQIGGVPLVDPKQVTLISLGLAVIVALGVGYIVLRPPVLAPLHEGRRLIDAVGWAAVLPQMLAALGAVFAAAGVGGVIARLVSAWIPIDVPIAVVAAYTIGMALFTVIMGNAFAAFPVMTAGIGLPLIVRHLGGDPVVMAAIGMLSGFCGTLMTPMAANFNIVPAALLELPDRYAVIKAQVPTALLMLIGNTALMYFLVFR